MPLLVFCPADTTRLLDALRRLEEFSSGDSPLDVTAVAAAAGRPVRVCTRRLLKENRVAFPVANSAYRYYLPPEELCRWLPDVAAGDGCPPKELFRWTKELLATPLFMPWESLRFLVLASSVHPWCNALKRLRRGAVYSEDELERLCDDLRQAASFGEERLVSQVQPPEAMPELAPVPLPEVPEGHPELPAIIHAGTLFVPCAFNDPAATILELHDELGESYGASGRLTIANDPAWRAFPLNAKVPFGRMFLGSLQAFGRRYNLRGESVSWEIEPPVTKTGEASPWFRIFLSLVLLCLGLGVGAYFFWGEHATVDNSPEEKPGGNLPEEKPGDNPPEGEPDGKPSEEKEPIPECGYIIIQAGDSTSSISERYGVAVEDLYKWNGYGELKVGDRYWLRESTPEELPLTPPPPPRLPIPECGYVIIQAGDSTSSISERYGVAVADLNKWNGSGRLEVGKKFWLRGPEPEEPPLPPPPPPRLPIPECGYVIIQAGDDTSSISERYGVAVADLNKWNGSGRLEVGKKFWLRGPTPGTIPPKEGSDAPGSGGTNTDTPGSGGTNTDTSEDEKNPGNSGSPPDSGGDATNSNKPGSPPDSGGDAANPGGNTEGDPPGTEPKNEKDGQRLPRQKKKPFSKWKSTDMTKDFSITNRADINQLNAFYEIANGTTAGKGKKITLYIEPAAGVDPDELRRALRTCLQSKIETLKKTLPNTWDKECGKIIIKDKYGEGKWVEYSVEDYVNPGE